MKKKSIAKFEIQDIVPIVIVFVVAGIAIAYGVSVQVDVRDDFVTNVASCGRNSTGGTAGTILYTTCGDEYNATQNSIEATTKFSSKLPLIATVVIAAILIGILVRYLIVKNQV